MVALISDMTDGCGIGYSSTNTQPYNMFTVTHYSCATGNYSFGHELAHNMVSITFIELEYCSHRNH